ncbi:MAG TPA: hypothetical protein VFB66_17365 [Tepidisphaeraceae bacterium]|nr:hypothetical protein [Tepidisphaeraceae bacterium]
MSRIRRLIASAAAAAAASVACVPLLAGPRRKAALPLQQVPRVVVHAAEKAVGGITLTKVKLRAKKGGVVFKLEGSARGKTYAIKVDAAGRVLDLGREAPRPGRLAKGRKEARPAGPIGETFPESPAVRVGFIRHAPVKESSGVVASRRSPGVFWTHNDKGNAPVLYAITREGTLLAEYHVAATHDDWEDVATDDAGNLYVGNIGNNNAERTWLEVHRVGEPGPDLSGGGAAAPRPSVSLRPDRTWRLKFPADPFDCESLFVHGGHGYVISKHHDGAPAGLYRFPLGGGDDVTLEKVTTLPTRGPVTAADLSPDGSTLAVLTYGALYTFPVHGDVSGASNVAPGVTATPPGKVEGACLTAGGVLVTAEGREVYFIPLVPNP